MSWSVDHPVKDSESHLLGIVLDLEDVGFAQLADALDFRRIELGMESNVGQQIEGWVGVRLQDANVDDRVIIDGKRAQGSADLRGIIGNLRGRTPPGALGQHFGGERRQPRLVDRVGITAIQYQQVCRYDGQLMLLHEQYCQTVVQLEALRDGQTQLTE